MSNTDSNGWLDKIFPTWFKKLQVTYSGELPLNENDKQQVLAIPYSLFKKAIQSKVDEMVREARAEGKKEGLKMESSRHVVAEGMLRQELNEIKNAVQNSASSNCTFPGCSLRHP